MELTDEELHGADFSSMMKGAAATGGGEAIVAIVAG